MYPPHQGVSTAGQTEFLECGVKLLGGFGRDVTIDDQPHVPNPHYGGRNLNYGVTVRTAVCVPPFIVAEIVEVVCAATTLLVTVNCIDVWPTAKVMLAGTVAAFALLLERLTLRCGVLPAAGAFSVTVAIEFVVPPFTVVGLSVMDNTWGASMVSVAVAEPFSVAVIVKDVLAPTDEVVTVKFAVVAPAGTVTVDGTEAEPPLAERLTTAPAPTAGLFNVTVPVEDWLPVTSVGFNATPATAGALIVKVAVLVTPL